MPDHKYAAMPGMKKTFLFMGVREGVILQRKFACWCHACMLVSGPGEGLMDTNYGCVACECADSLPWAETCIDREDAPGIAAARARTLAHARALAVQLKTAFSQSSEPVWVAVQNRGEDDPDQAQPASNTGTHTHTPLFSLSERLLHVGSIGLAVRGASRRSTRS